MNPTTTSLPELSRGTVLGFVPPQELEKELSVTLYERPGSHLENAIIRGITLISYSAIAAVLLIFIFIAKESLPVLLQQTDNSRSGLTMKLEDAVNKSPAELAVFLQLTESQVARLSPDVLQQLIVSRNEELKAGNSPDSKLNTTTWGMMFLPYQWEGYNMPVFIWQPIGNIEKYNVIPLIFGSLKITFIALLFAMPLSLMAATYVSQLARPETREVIKPFIELLAGVPSVVLGFLGLTGLSVLLGPLHIFDSHYTPLNALVAGMALALAVIPVIFTIAEDAITAVPVTHKRAALAIGATNWHATMRVVVPAAMPGIFAAVVLGFARAIGETMVVLLASGNAATLDLSIFQSARTLTATIAAELNEAAQDSAHYHILFFIGTMLFFMTFLGNILADIILQRLKSRLEGSTAAEAHRLAEQAETQLGSSVV